MPHLRILISAVVLALFPGLWAGGAHAADPPALAGRLSYVDGTVSFHAAGQAQWSYAGVNYPVTSGESFWTEPGGRDEIQIGSSVVRMDNASELDVLRLDSTITQLQLDQGTINFRLVRNDPNHPVEIETPHGAVSLVQPGTYHIDAGSDTMPTVVAMLEGEARFIGPHSYLDIQAGEQATALGDPARYTMAEAITTPFDDWALQRDARERERKTAKYVSPEVTGAEDLDNYGAWQTVPQYGPVWIPASVPAEWAPYHDGHWAWVEPWGWTWIDGQPWGFAPFHYGRWAQVNQHWAWVPGPIVQQPVYAPALVAFTGGLPGVGIGIAGLAASIGWLPLAPDEVYYPPYHPSLNYLRHVNQGAVPQAQLRIINNNYTTINRTVNNYANAGAATAVPGQAFVNARPVQSAATAVTPQMRAAPVTASLTSLQPTAVSRVAALPSRRNAVAPAEAPGPTAAQQHEEAQAIEHAEPRSLSTAGVQQAHPVEGQTPAAPDRAEAAATPHAALTPEESEARGGAPGPHPVGTPAVIPEAKEQTARTAANSAFSPAAETGAVRPEQVEAERRTAQTEAARPAAESGKAETPREEASREPGAAAPGPSIKERQPVPLRQQQLAASQAAEKPREAAASHAEAQAARKAGPAPQPEAKARPAIQQAAFKPAEVARPAQSAPLKPTPQGWNRHPAAASQPAPAKPAAPAVDKKDGDKK
jgi:hypothetical protein